MYDLTIIGAGIGGYAAAIRAAELGAKVCIIEKDTIGGTCLNKGCIPTKSLVNSARVLCLAKRASIFGVDVQRPKADIGGITRRKEEVVTKLRNSMEAQLKPKGVEIVKAAAHIYDKNTVKAGNDSISSKYIIIAAGSHPLERGELKFDHKYLLSSDDILDLVAVPQKLAIVGGGYIGCEFASIYCELGSEVTIIEIENQLLPSGDRETARRLEASFKKRGIKVIKGIKIDSVDVKGGVSIILEDKNSVYADIVLLSIGRKPSIEGLGLDAAGIRTDNGSIAVDEDLRTSIPNIYAIGDVTGRHYLAHVASYEGILVSDNLFGSQRAADYSAVPSCIFTSPEIASVGLTEENAKKAGIEFSVAKIPFTAISKAHITNDTEGIIKLICDKKSGRILGAQIFGESAAELISGFTIAIRNSLTVTSLTETIFAHPTMSEGILEAAQRAKGNKSEMLNTKSEIKFI